MILVLIGLSILAFFIKAERTKLPKLFKVLSWLVIICFSINYFYALYEYVDFGILGMYSFIFTKEFPNGLIFIELAILLILNMISVSNKIKALILSVSQVAISLLGCVIFAVYIVIVMILGKGKTNIAKRKSYSEQEDIYAKANGFYDAETANASGFKTAEANQPGFDFTKKREY